MAVPAATALLPGGGAELRQVVLQERDQASVFGEVAGLQRSLRLVVVVGGLLHQLRDRLRRRGRRRRRAGWTRRGARAGRRRWAERWRGGRARAEDGGEGLLVCVGHGDLIVLDEDE